MLCKICISVPPYSTEFQSAFNLYWHGEGAAGFPFLRGTCRQVWNNIWWCVRGMPQKDNLDDVAHTCMLSYPIVVSHFNFLCLVLLYSVSISVVSAYKYMGFLVMPPVEQGTWICPAGRRPTRARGLHEGRHRSSTPLADRQERGSPYISRRSNQLHNMYGRTM